MIQIMIDSPCDLPQEIAQQYQIDVLPIPILVDGTEYRERVELQNQEFYEVLKNAKKMPTHAQITALEFLDRYKMHANRGVSEIVVITINAKGSGMYDAARLAANMFYEETDKTASEFPIYVVDSKTYTMAYGYAAVEAARMAEKGASGQQIVEYLEDYFTYNTIYFSPYTLEYVKKSGRVSCAAAFVGEALGLRPVISFVNGDTNIVTKIRGDKNIIPKITELVKRDRAENTPYLIVYGDHPEYGEAMARIMEKEFGYPPIGLYSIGAAISINAGPTVVGVAFRRKNLS